MTGFVPVHKVEDRGWACPKCNSVYSPNVPECYRCNDTISAGQWARPVTTHNQSGSQGVKGTSGRVRRD